MQLISAKAGLTNYYVNQVLRNNQVDMSNNVIDRLVSENLSGGVSKAALINAAAMSGCLNAQASDFANIVGGWNDSKGLMKLDFICEQSPVNVVYMHVIGYIVNNDVEGLSTNAKFVPQFSWKTEELQVGSGDLYNPVTTKRTIGHRVDYLLNDGSTTNKMVGLRPTDIIELGINEANKEDIIRQMEDEGLVGMAPSMSTASSDINRLGVVASRRSNLNPSQFAAEMLNAGTDYQHRIRNYQGNGYGSEAELSIGEGIDGELSMLAHGTGQREPGILRDQFFNDMNSALGQVRMNGFNGYSIGDLIYMYENFETILDLTLYDNNMFTPADFTQTAQTMGTSSIGEIIAHQVMFNVADLLVRHGLAGVSFRGSNCDGFGGDDDFSNVILLPYGGVSLSNDDWGLGPKVDNFCKDLSTQIFARLKGEGYNAMTPIRFEVYAELFGSTTINLQIVDDANIQSGFSMDQAGAIEGMKQWVFPTFAINNASSVVGTSDAALMAGANFLENIRNYFS